MYDGARIAVIGDNGSGKTSLLKILTEAASEPSYTKDIVYCDGATIAYVPQTIADYPQLSGGERFNEALSVALAKNPDLLILDEPTNHLDAANRQTLTRLLDNFSGAIIAASHDTALINKLFSTLWHIYNSKIIIFNGTYAEYRKDLEQKRTALMREVSAIKREKKQLHDDLMREQERASKRKQAGLKKYENKRILLAKLHAMQDSGERTSGKKRSHLSDDKQLLEERLSELYTPEVVKPKFRFTHASNSKQAILQITNGTVSYESGFSIDNINITLGATSRLALTGTNGSGKSTIIRAILQESGIKRTGSWFSPERKYIGYLDQHYAHLNDELTVLESAKQVANIPTAELRSHLNSFLFRKNEEVNAKVSSLSGGERVRLTLALITLDTPSLLILDEITNNIDLATREHIAQVLLEYTGALLVVSHDKEFLHTIKVSDSWTIQ
ncbi:erythromycin ABC transporter ATP-binding protein [Deferribacterales bacterium]|nr:erythromycin ABC transporter ATP-binding protein [Deferribacterales bacterium]